MFCPQCGARNPEGSRFCSSCANQLPTGSGGASSSQGQGPQGTMIMPPPASSQPSAPPPPYAPPQEQNYGGTPYPQAPSPGYQQPYPQPQPQQQYQQYPGYQQQPPSYSGSGKAGSKATTALILSIASIFPGLCISFIPFVGLIAPALGIAGAVIGKNELEAINQGRSSRAGEGFAKAGFIIGIIGGIFNLLGALGACIGVIKG